MEDRRPPDGDRGPSGDDREPLDADSEPLGLDGSAGGGQLLRTALALSMVADRPFRMENVRGDRPNPGLRPQHLGAVRAAAAVGDASVEGAEEGSEELTFRPGAIAADRRPGERVEVDVGTAGSVTLLFDALLPVALAIDDPLAVTATGGTDVKWSPTMAHHQRAKLPLLRRSGVFATVDADRTGFYPAGGGEATLWLAPSAPPPLDLTDRGSLEGVRIHSKASADLATADVAERQAESAAERLREVGLAGEAGETGIDERTASTVEAASTGSSVAVVLDYGRTTAGFDALGEQGKPAERVGAEAAEAALRFHGYSPATPGRGVVDVHTADQLVVFLALAGGRVAIPEVTDHVRTGVDLVAEFGFPVTVDEGDPPVLSAPPPE